MEINKNNLFARYYQWIYGNLPNDICTLFWGSLLIIGLFFLFVPGRLLLGRKAEVISQFGVGMYFWLGYGTACLVGMIVVDAFGYQFINLWGYLLLGALIGGGVLALIALALVGTVYVSVKKLPETTVAQNTKDWIGAIKRNHCTKINWE